MQQPHVTDSQSNQARTSILRLQIISSDQLWRSAAWMHWRPPDWSLIAHLPTTSGCKASDCCMVVDQPSRSLPPVTLWLVTWPQQHCPSEINHHRQCNSANVAASFPCWCAPMIMLPKCLQQYLQRLGPPAKQGLRMQPACKCSSRGCSHVSRVPRAVYAAQKLQSTWRMGLQRARRKPVQG